MAKIIQYDLDLTNKFKFKFKEKINRRLGGPVETTSPNPNRGHLHPCGTDQA
jgi:hypothetical protein